MENQKFRTPWNSNRSVLETSASSANGHVNLCKPCKVNFSTGKSPAIKRKHKNEHIYLAPE